MSTIRIMLVEDDLDYRYLIEQALRREADFELCTSCTDGKSAVQTALMEQPDIVLMDLCLAHSPIDGAEASRQIRLQTDARVIILTSREDFETVIHASTHAFASAYLFKSNFPVLIPMIRETAQGVTSQAHLICSALLAPLTDAERSVLRHLLGEDVRLHSSSKTISNQQTGILRKLGLPGKKELTKLAIKPDVIDPEDAEMLQDLVISAVNEALRQADDAMNSSMSSLTGGLNIPGLGL